MSFLREHSVIINRNHHSECKLFPRQSCLDSQIFQSTKPLKNVHYSSWSTFFNVLFFSQSPGGSSKSKPKRGSTSTSGMIDKGTPASSDHSSSSAHQQRTVVVAKTFSTKSTCTQSDLNPVAEGGSSSGGESGSFEQEQLKSDSSSQIAATQGGDEESENEGEKSKLLAKKCKKLAP